MNPQIAQFLAATKSLFGASGRFSIDFDDSSPAPQSIGRGVTIRLGNRLVGTYDSQDAQLLIRFEAPFPQIISQRWFGRISAPVTSVAIETDGILVELTGLPDQRIPL